MSHKPAVIDCPECGFMRVNRRAMRCGSCQVVLYYVGDYMTEDGWLWVNDQWHRYTHGKVLTV